MFLVLEFLTLSCILIVNRTTQTKLVAVTLEAPKLHVMPNTHWPPSENGKCLVLGHCTPFKARVCVLPGRKRSLQTDPKTSR